jgi:hypothetical protein
MILDESQHALVRLGNADGAGLAELAFAEWLTNGLHPAAGICASFEDDDRTARCTEKAGRVQASHAAADHDHRIDRVGRRLGPGESLARHERGRYGCGRQMKKASAIYSGHFAFGS